MGAKATVEDAISRVGVSVLGDSPRQPLIPGHGHWSNLLYRLGRFDAGHADEVLRRSSWLPATHVAADCARGTRAYVPRAVIRERHGMVRDRPTQINGASPARNAVKELMPLTLDSGVSPKSTTTTLPRSGMSKSSRNI